MPGRSAGHPRISTKRIKTWMAGTSPAMTRTIFASANFGLTLFYESDKPLDVLDRRVGLNAMAQIENEGA